jgi:hypothetical protein
MRRANLVGLLTVVLAFSLNVRAEDKPAEQAPQASAPSEAPPKDAIVLFDGTNLDQWTKIDGKTPAEWTIKDGYAEGKASTTGGHGNDIQTKQKFKDYHLHLEFWLPQTPGKNGEAKANSGVFLQRFYEIQILDSYGKSKDELKKGDCGAVYRQKVPDENACLPPEQWQTYDIDFKAARFDNDHNKLSKAVVTVVLNGKTVQKDVEIDGATRAGTKESMDNNEDVIIVQYHGHPVRFRNIWIVPKTDTTDSK